MSLRNEAINGYVHYPECPERRTSKHLAITTANLYRIKYNQSINQFIGQLCKKRIMEDNKYNFTYTQSDVNTKQTMSPETEI